MISDLEWWLETLSKPSMSKRLRPRGTLIDLGISINASMSWGIGIIIKGQWAAFRLSPDWKVGGRDICWLETLAIELLTYILVAMDHHDEHVLVRSDNIGAMGAQTKGRCSNWHINLSVRRTYTTLSAANIIPGYEYIESALNPADPISHGELGCLEDRLPVSITLPEELTEVLVHV